MQPIDTPPDARWRRFDKWDERKLRLDHFAPEAPELGFSTMKSPFDPAPQLVVEQGRVTVMDGKSEADFDLIDIFIARHHLDLAVAEEAMATDSLAVARMLVDINVARESIERLVRGMTPAKIVDVVSHLSALELTFAINKMKQRSQPGNQAHVTNAKDDPLQLAADAATASLFGFDEIETTMRVADNAWANALACTVGTSVGRGGVLFQCSIEESEELQIGMQGLTSYAETISVYGTEQSFTDGDDTPWSKGFLTAAYASRGIKARCTSGGGSELLMGFHERKSILYLEARCLCLQRAMGVQGTQNGGIDGAPLTVSLPAGVREILAENLIAMCLGLECATGNDTRSSESDMRVGSKITPFLMAGTEFVFSGMGSIERYDNSFDISLFNGEELEEFLVLQRDFEADGGLRSVEGSEVLGLRQRAVEAVSAVLEELGLDVPEEEMKESVVAASGSKETIAFSPGRIVRISQAIKSRRISAIDVASALLKRGFRQEADNMLSVLRQRVSGDYLQTSAILRDGKVVSAVNHPNAYTGPGTGYRMTQDRWKEVKSLRDLTSQDKVLGQQASSGRGAVRLKALGKALRGTEPLEVVIAISPAFGGEVHFTTAGHPVGAVLEALLAGLKSGGAIGRIVRCHHTADTSFLGLTAAKLSGSEVGIGIQAKGTAVIHRSDRLPHLNLELFSNAPATGLEHYRAMGHNAALYAAGQRPEPVVVPSTGNALGSRFHVPAALIHAVEINNVRPGEPPVEIELTSAGEADL